MKKAIVTGSNGFIGRAVVQELLRHDYRVYALGRREESVCPESEQLTYLSMDLAEIGGLARKIPPDGYDSFYHLGWQGITGAMRANPAVQLQNAQWTLDALRAAKELGCRRFLCAGSIMERETMAAVSARGNRPGMGYVYGGGKLISHIMCTCVAAQIGIDLIWPVLTNAYGVGEDSPRLVNSAIRSCIRGESPSFTAGTQNYDFVYIDDAARAFRLIGERGKPFHEYLIGSSTARPLREFLLEMRAALAPELEFHFGAVPFTGVDLPLSQFDCSRTERDTGFRAEVGFGEGCRRTMDWLRTREGGEYEQNHGN